MSIHAPSKATTAGPARAARQGGEEVVRSKSFERLARAGFAARGIVYAIVGILAIRLAVGVPGTNASQQGAMRAVAAQPFGKALLILVAIGLAGYATWRLVRAALGHGPEDSDSGFDRLAALGSGVVYAGLTAIAVEILLGAGGGELRQPAEDDGGRARLARRAVARRHRRPRADRDRLLPGLQGAEQGLPRGLEDGGDEPAGAALRSSGSASSAISPVPSCTGSSASS